MAKTPKIDEKDSARASLKYLRISPQKVRLVLDAVRKKPVHQALRHLAAVNRKAARLAEKLLVSALANAKVKGLDESRLYISDIRADGGPTLKRFMPRSMGRADQILKRTTHMLLIVKEAERPFKDAPAAQVAAAEEEKDTKNRKRTAKKKAGTAKA